MRRESWGARAAAVLGVIFVFAAWGKIRDPATFAELIYHYEIVPDWMGNLTAVTLPWVELIAALCLIIGLWQRPAALLVAAMLLIFMAVTGQAWLRGLEIEDCGCFAGGPPRTPTQVLLEDLLMLIFLAAPAFLWAPRRRRAEGKEEPDG